MATAHANRQGIPYEAGQQCTERGLFGGSRRLPLQQDPSRAASQRRSAGRDRRPSSE